MNRQFLPVAFHDEFDQFHLLCRGSVRRLLNAALIARDTDSAQFALWALVLVATPPAMYAFRQLINYSALRFQPASIIEHAIQVDRMFFLLYGMVVAALVAAAAWEALLPDRADQEIVGSLPVRPRTMAAARLGASLWLAAVASAAISVPAAVFLALAAPSHPALGFLPVVLVAHLVATMGASLFMFTLLLIARATLALCFGAHASERLATGLQVLTIASLAELFFFIPGVIPALIDRLATGDRLALLIPSMPYAALYAWIVGIRYPSIAFGAAMAPLALLVAIFIAIALYLWPARWLAWRALETQPHQHTSVVSTLARLAIRALPLSPAVRAVSIFTVTTIFRNRPHQLVVTAYFGLALAIGTLSVIAGSLRGTLSFQRPETSLVALPLVAMFFLVLGLRAAFAIPSDVDANWVFRLSQPRVASSVDAAATSLVALSVVPVAAIAGAGALALEWPTHDALMLATLDVASGCVLAEWTLRKCRAVPFTCVRSSDVESLKSRWLAQVVPLLVFAFVNAAIQKSLLQSPRAAAWYVGGAVAAWSALRVKRRLTWRNVGVQFDASPSDSMATLDLSEAIG
jgi:hypothetical protein